MNLKKFVLEFVLKFGGSSLANHSQWNKVISIILSNLKKRVVVFSALGKAYKDDTKVTDLLKQIYKRIIRNEDWDDLWDKIFNKYMDLVLVIDKGHPRDKDIIRQFVRNKLIEVKEFIKNNPTEDFIASRGEYLSAFFMDYFFRLMGHKSCFIDAKDLIFFKEDGSLDENKTYDAIWAKVPAEGFVFIPGYYGTDINGKIKTFPRGGSDLTGAIVASMLNVKVYENWTDVPGFFTANPKEVEDAIPISEMTYNEAEILADAGSEVIHPLTLSFIMKNKVVVHIRNTNDPEAKGTYIVPEMDEQTDKIVGVVQQGGYVVLDVAKMGAYQIVGFTNKISQVFIDNNISYAYELDSGRNKSSFAIKEDQIKSIPALVNLVKKAVSADDVSARKNVAVINSISYKDANYTDILLIFERNNIEKYYSRHSSQDGQIRITLHEDDALRATKLIHKRFFG